MTRIQQVGCATKKKTTRRYQWIWSPGRDCLTQSKRLTPHIIYDTGKKKTSSISVIMQTYPRCPGNAGC